MGRCGGGWGDVKVRLTGHRSAVGVNIPTYPPPPPTKLKTAGQHLLPLSVLSGQLAIGGQAAVVSAHDCGQLLYTTCCGEGRAPPL